MTNKLSYTGRALGFALCQLLILACIELTQLGASPLDANLRVSFIGCASHESDGQTLNIVDVRNGGILSTIPLETKQGILVWRASIPLPSGLYQVAVGPAPCADTEPVAILRGRDRSIVVKGTDVLSLREGWTAVAGSLPSSGLEVSADCISPSGARNHYEADVDGDAYYFEAGPPSRRVFG
jgi:hypothetical protein